MAHVVRHPLKVLSSSVAFGQCVECWVHIEEFVVPPFAANGSDLTSAVRATILANRERKRDKPMGGWSALRSRSIILVRPRLDHSKHECLDPRLCRVIDPRRLVLASVAV